MSKEEVFLRNVKKSKKKKNFRINFQAIWQKISQDQKWVYYSIAGSFVLLIILNFFIPATTEATPYNFKEGLLGMILTFFGLFCLINLLLLEIGKQSTLSFVLTTLVSIILAIVLLYFGLPLFFGFKW